MNKLFEKRHSRVRIAELTRQGLSATAVAEAVGCARSTVSEVRRVLGLNVAWLDKRELRRLHADGWNDSQIAKRLNVPRSTVWTARKRLGLKANAWGRPRKATTGEQCRA